MEVLNSNFKGQLRGNLVTWFKLTFAVWRKCESCQQVILMSEPLIMMT